MHHHHRWPLPAASRKMLICEHFTPVLSIKLVTIYMGALPPHISYSKYLHIQIARVLSAVHIVTHTHAWLKLLLGLTFLYSFPYCNLLCSRSVQMRAQFNEPFTLTHTLVKYNPLEVLNKLIAQFIYEIKLIRKPCCFVLL